MVIDRFQVLKNLQEQLTAARRELPRALPAEEARALKGSRWLWLTNPENLEEDQLQQLRALRAQFPSLAQLADQREALRQIFEEATLTTPAAGAASPVKVGIFRDFRGFAVIENGRGGATEVASLGSERNDARRVL